MVASAVMCFYILCPISKHLGELGHRKRPVSGFRKWFPTGASHGRLRPRRDGPFLLFFYSSYGDGQTTAAFCAARASALLGAASGFRKEPGTRCCFGMDGWKPPWAAVLGENGISFQNLAVLYPPPPSLSKIQE